MPTIDERIEEFLDELEVSTLTAEETELIKAKIRFLREIEK